MSWLENIRNKPKAEKIKLIWIIAGTVAAILIIIWVLAGKYNAGQGDVDIFKDIDQIIEQAGKNKPDLNPKNN